MLKRWLSFTSHSHVESLNGSGQPGSAHQAVGLMELAEECQRSGAASVEPAPKQIDFDQIYLRATVKPPAIPYSILKVVDMAASTHLQGMTPEAKRSALLMALEAGGAEIEDLLQDALVRQRALNDYAEKQQERLSRFEAEKLEENRTIQAELDRISGQYVARIQANLNEVARRQDDLLAWEKKKQQESQRIADTAAFLVPQGGSSYSSGITAVLERGSQSRRLA
jgi:hypothetical protein